MQDLDVEPLLGNGLMGKCVEVLLASDIQRKG